MGNSPAIGRRAGWHRLASLAATGLLIVSATITGWDAVSRWKEHADGVESWGLEVHHSAVEIADALSTAIRAVEEDMVLRSVPAAETLLNGRAPADAVMAGFQDSKAHLPQIAFYAIFGRSGDLMATTEAGLRRQRITARERDFLRHFASGASGTFVTASYLIGPAFDRNPPMYILIVRRLDDARGSFAGVLVAAMTADYVLHGLVDPALYPGKDVRLFLDNGKLLAVHRDGTGKIGDNFAAHPLLRERAGPALQWGVLPDPFDDAPEIAALGKVDDLPFLISVMTVNGPTLIGWWHRLAILGVLAAASLLGATYFAAKGLSTAAEPNGAAEADDAAE